MLQGNRRSPLCDKSDGRSLFALRCGQQQVPRPSRAHLGVSVHRALGLVNAARGVYRTGQCPTMRHGSSRAASDPGGREAGCVPVSPSV